jgi:hypothetical protein
LRATIDRVGYALTQAQRAEHVLRISVAVLVLAMLTNAPALTAQDRGAQDPTLVAEVLGTQVRANEPDELRALIIRPLLERYAADGMIEVTPDEIGAYQQAIDRLAAEDRARRTERRGQLARRVAAENLSEDERKALASEIATLDELSTTLDELAAGASENPEEAEQARQTVAAAFIRQWKINQALYRQYGGRIIFQQGGPEPLDAYRRFLEDQQHRGAFRILTNEFEEEFWRYFVTDALHSFYQPGSKEEAQAFEVPWWLLSPADPAR